MSSTKSSPPRFSVVIVARDEARSLPELLFDLDDFCGRGGDLMLLDTGSTDDTAAIARRYGCRVEEAETRFDSELDATTAAEIERRFVRGDEGPLVEAGQRLFHFADARQYAGMSAANRFVLQVDGSDELMSLDIDAFDRWIEAGGVRAFEYEQTYGNVRLQIARFYDRTRYHWEGRVHEVLMATDPADTTPTVRCDLRQLQVRHTKDPSKQRNYLAGLALQVIEHPDKPRWWHYLGRELYYQHWFASAIATLEAHAAMDTWPAERSQSCCFMGESWEALGRSDEAKAAYQRAIELDSTRREPVLRLAALHSRHGEFAAAAQCAFDALAIPRTSALPEPDGNYTWLPHSILYWSLFWLGRKDEARAHWETCMVLAPEESKALQYARLFPSPTATPGASPPSAAGQS
jgi:tetratricopeptide (TPR) repeat protein